MSRRAQPDNRADEPRRPAPLERALELARREHPHPNPRVGAVVVATTGEIAGEAAHVRAGEPHAEVLALRAAGDAALGGTLYVTLEPCAHHGRTPPCTEAIVAAGIGRVVIAAGDPDGRVAGRGVADLEQAGITVEANVARTEGEALDPGYFHHRRTGRPLVTLKLAATLDGQAAAADGTSQWLTGPDARADAHRLRARSDAVMIGAGTLRADDPRLDVRIPGYDDPQPRPVVIAGDSRLPNAAQLWSRSPLVYRAAIHGDEPETAEVVTVPDTDGVDLDAVVKDLGSRGVLDLLVEGGPTLASHLLSAGLVDRLVVYLGAKLAGGSGKPMIAGAFRTLTDAATIEILGVTSLGSDLRVDARLVGRA